MALESRMAKPVCLSVIVPVYNEESTVAALVQRIRVVPLDTEIIAVDDASSDNSALILERLRAEGLVNELIRQPVNRGKGAAVRAGIAAATR